MTKFTTEELGIIRGIAEFAFPPGVRPPVVQSIIDKTKEEK